MQSERRGKSYRVGWVHLDADRVELAGRADALHLAERAGEVEAVAARHAEDGPRLAVGAERHRPEQLEADRRVEQGDRVVDGAGLAGDGREPGGGRQVRLATLRGLAGREAGRVPADQRLHRRVGRVADDDRATAGADQADGVGPAPQRLLLDPQVGQAEHQPGVEQDDGRVATGGHRLRARGGHDDGRLVVDRGQHPVTTRGADHGAGERPAQLLRGAGLPHDRCPQAAVAALGTGPGLVGGSAPPAGRWRGGRAERQRAGADPAARRGAAALAGQGRGVPAARGLHEHRSGRERVADRVVHLGRHPGGPGQGIPGQRVLVGTRDRDGDPGPQLLAGGGELVRPARADQLLGLDAHREAPHQRGRPLALGTQQQGLAGVWVGRPRLGVQVVAVVPDHHEAEVLRPARTPRRGCRPRPAGDRARRRGSRGSASRDRRPR